MALAPWCANERWEFFKTNPNLGELSQETSAGCKYARVTGRQRAPSELTKNVGWWFRNDFEQQLSEAPWYHPEWPEWRRNMYWNYFRNPAQNGNMFVWGVADRNYSVEVLDGVLDPLVVQKNDVMDITAGRPLDGYQKCRLYAFEDGSKDRFWSAHSVNPTPEKNGMQVNSGYQPTGIFQVKFNIIKWEGWPWRHDVPQV